MWLLHENKNATSKRISFHFVWPGQVLCSFFFGDMNNAFSKSFEGTPIFFMKKKVRVIWKV